MIIQQNTCEYILYPFSRSVVIKNGDTTDLEKVTVEKTLIEFSSVYESPYSGTIMAFKCLLVDIRPIHKGSKEMPVVSLGYLKKYVSSLKYFAFGRLIWNLIIVYSNNCLLNSVGKVTVVLILNLIGKMGFIYSFHFLTLFNMI